MWVYGMKNIILKKKCSLNVPLYTSFVVGWRGSCWNTCQSLWWCMHTILAITLYIIFLKKNWIFLTISMCLDGSYPRIATMFISRPLKNHATSSIPGKSIEPIIGIFCTTVNKVKKCFYYVQPPRYIFVPILK